MRVNTETVLLSLAAGGVIGLLSLFFLCMSRLSGGKKILIFLQDMTFTVLSFMISFLVSFPISNGRIRLLQVLLELLSFSVVWLLFSPLVRKLSDLLITMRARSSKYLRDKFRKLTKSASKAGKNSKNIKKRLDILPRNII